MQSFSQVAVVVAVLAVAAVLVLGLINMLRQGTGNRSQMLMRWRVGLQFMAIVVIVAALYFKAHG